MTGITGGTVSGNRLGRMVDALAYEEWYASERFEVGNYGLGAQHHGERDPRGHAFWTDDRTVGAVDGAITNLDELGWDVPDVFERLLRAPERTLEAMEGPFTVACVDGADDRIVVGTDKIGSRPCYYATGNGFVFGSGLAPLLAVLDDPAVNEQGVSDLLLMGNMWSDTTILEGVRSIHPATVLEYEDGDVTERRYWRPDYDPADPTEEYFYRLVRQFQRAMDRTARSVTGDLGLWLSGGLDSRATANELARNYRNGSDFESFVAYTYDANPGNGVNPELARQVTDALEVPLENVPLTPDRFLPVMEKVIDVTDGMIRWDTALNLSAAFNIERRDPDVLMEGFIGELFGQHLCRHHLTDASSLVRSMYESEATLSAEEVKDVLDVPVDPLGSFRKEAYRIDEPTFERGVVDAHFQNYYPRLAHASNPVARCRAGTRVPHADGDFLSQAARLPVTYRMGALPAADEQLIYGVVKPKIRMIRFLNGDLAEIPYERSRLKPTYPYPLHVAGFFASTALSQLKSEPTYGGKSLSGTWYRSHDDLQQRLDDLIDDACDRPFVDADAIRQRQQRHLRGDADEMDVLGPLTTLESWLQRHLD